MDPIRYSLYKLLPVKVVYFWEKSNVNKKWIKENYFTTRWVHYHSKVFIILCV